LPGIGKRQPIILVHGFNGGPKDTWNPPNESDSMQKALNNLAGVYTHFPDDTFDYIKANTQWVTDPRSGPALRDRIACVAESSREAGGPGKVILIAYSLGGLVAKFASNLFDANDQPIANDIGYIIDIASPSGGVDIAGLGALFFDTTCLFGYVQVGKAYIKQLRDTCNLMPITEAVQTNIHSLLNTLRSIPRSIPVFAIAGSVETVESYYDASIPLSGNDLFVSVQSALKDANALPNGLGGTYITRCTTTVPIIYFSFSTCDHLGISHNTEVEGVVIAQINKYLDVIHPPCPATVGMCLGVRDGDVDGNGVPDRMGVTFNPNTPCNVGIIFNQTCSITLHVALDNGDYIEYPSQLTPYCFETCGFTVGFLGLTPMNGKAKDIVVSPYCNMFSCPFVAYQVRNGQVQQIQFLGGSGSPATNRGDVGFVCSVVSGAYQVEAFSSVSEAQTNNTIDEVYKADSSGNMDLVSSKLISLSSIPSSERGPRCSGLSVPS